MQRHVRSISKPHRRRTEDKLNLDELANAPNLGGMLSFLEVPPEEAQRRHAVRQAMEREESTDPEGHSSLRVRAMNAGSHTVGIPPTVGHENVEAGFASLPPETREFQGESIVNSAKHQASVHYTAEVERPPVGDIEAVDFESIPSSSQAQIRRTQEPQLEAASNYSEPTLVETPTIVQRPPVGVTKKLELLHTAAQPPVAIGDPENAPVIPPTEGYSTRQVEQPPMGDTTTCQKTSQFVIDPPGVDLATGYLPSLGLSTPTHKRERIFRATLVQHGHSPAEQILYQAMWNHGSSLSNGSRQITAGYRELGYMTNLNDKTIKYNLQSLERKLAIRVTAPEHTATRTGRTYQVFSYEQILPRRSQAGLVWVRKTKGVEFISIPQTAQPPMVGSPIVAQPTSTTKSSSPINPTQGRHTTVPAYTLATEVGSTTEPVGAHTTQLGSFLGIDRNTSTTTTAPPIQLVKALSQMFPAIDHLAVKTLWNECRLRAVDCTVEEVLYFVADKMPIARNGKIQNPVGFILTCIPRCFEGDTFTTFRDLQARGNREREETERKRKEQETLVAEACRCAEEKFASLSKEEYEALYERFKLPLLAGNPAAKRWDKEILEASIRRRILQEFQERELARLL